MMHYLALQSEPTPSFWERSADPIAVYTLVLAIATIALWLSTWRLLKETKRSVDLARSEFNTTHRPRLHVRNIVAQQSGPYAREEFAFSPGEPLGGQFYVSNVGSGSAKIVESHVEVVWDLKDGLPMRRPYEGKDGNNPLPRSEIPSGASTIGQFLSERLFPGLDWDLNGRSNVYVMGWVEYVDARDVRRRTAFCRRYIERDGSRRFFPVNDPDYEHEE